MGQAILRGEEAMQVQQAILLYGNDKQSNYATIHNINLGSKGMALAEGHPLTQAALTKIVNSLAKTGQRTGLFLPENVLSLGIDSVVWYVKPAKRHTWFKCSNDIIGDRNGVTPQPGLVFMAGAGKWKVFAVKGNERPTPETLLYRSPFFNTWQSGEVCRGTVDLPKSCLPENLGKWESAYFDTVFTHPNDDGPNKLVKFRGGAYALWKSLLDGKHAKFPDKVLVPTKLTLNDLLTTTFGGGK